MKLFLMAASLRKDSVNKKLITLCAKHLEGKHEIDHAQMNDFDMPLYDGDIETEKGIPDTNYEADRKNAGCR